MTSPIALPPSCEEPESCDCGGPGCHCEDGGCYCDRNGCYSNSAETGSGAYCEGDGCFCDERVCGCAVDGDCEVQSADGLRTCRGEGCLCDRDQCMCEAPAEHPCECSGGGDVGGGCVLPGLFNPP
ncbi:MAG: hypothetical protein A2138_22015 [Deltaproteobacteria bacterium RBG_16_71_12]|nr:MAG: hypothetical protein A2138_22015 [Deltaproteobacteria bacterium RBG_16_71_12]